MYENQGFEVKLQNEAVILPDRKDLTVLLFQSIRELLLNVLKHSGVKSAVVKMERKNGELWIIIIDRGKGFDPETVLKSAGSRQNFGLICIRERLMHLGGRLELESTPNAGSSISLIVPLDEKIPVEKALPEASDKIYSKPVSVQPGIGDKIRVLLADDHPIVRQGLVTMLNLQPDIEVVGEASDGEEAVSLAKKLQPDVILMDINMPRMNGLEATRIIHSEFPDIRIIGLSMYAEDEQAAAIIAAGASAYRSKSENTALLLAAIRGGVE
jgi:CheY-like chemotaxis protein